MNTINKSSGFSPFQLQMGQSPHLIPLLIIPVATLTPEELRAWDLIEQLQADVCEAQDNLVKAKVLQAAYANVT